jgi:Protein of unknown function (DUF3551)
MRTIAIAATAAALLLSAGASQAREYAWCAIYHDKYGATNCGFDTWEQCRATVSGIGGICSQNPSFQPGLVGPRTRKPRRHLR